MRRFERRAWLAAVLALALSASGWRSALAQGPSLESLTPHRTPIVVGLPVPQTEQSGELALQPNVVVNGAPPTGPSAVYPDPRGANAVQAAALARSAGSAFGVVPAGATMPPSGVAPAGQAMANPPAAGMPLPNPFAPGGEELPPGLGTMPQSVEPLFGPAVGAGCGCGGGHHGSHGGTFYGLGGIEEGSGDPGIGHERVMFALFEIPSSQPSSNMRFRYNSFYDEHSPDRADYFWAQIGGAGPKLPEHLVNYQDASVAWEVAAGKAFSLTTEMPLRFVSPDINPTTGGLGDMALTTKTVLLNGNDWQITQYFRTDLPTGSPAKGLGTGHTSLEPGFLFQLKWTNETYFHSMLTYWIPLGDNPVYGGQVLKYGFGISHLLYENDSFAAIPTLEFVGWTVLNGAQTTFPTGLTQPVDTMGIFNVQPGIRFVHNTGGDLGLIEWGVSSSFAITPNRWYDASVLLKARFVF